MARFGLALKLSKASQQLSKALEAHNPPQQLSRVAPLLCHGTSLGPTSCFYSVGSLRRYPTFLLARPSTRCVMFALDSPGSTRRPNKRLAQWAPVRMLLRRLFHGSCSGFTSPLQGNKVMIRIGGCSGELPKILVKIMDKHDKYGNMWDNIA